MKETKEYTLYNDTVMDHFLNPRNMGDVSEADGVGEVGAAACGDIMKISLKIRNGKIEDARFKTFGCGSAIASSSMATELIKGRTIEEAKNFSNQEVVNVAAVYDRRTLNFYSRCDSPGAEKLPR